jgi:hypothetical protein
MNEPVAWMDKRTNKCVVFINTPPSNDWIPLYAHPSEHELGIAEAIGFDKGYNANKLDDLTNEEILCLWDWWSGEILSTDILDFANTYKRVLLGEEGLLEWHKEYVKKMNEQHPSGKVTEK